MTQRNVGQILDEAVAYHYVGVPVVNIADFWDSFNEVYRSFERPRFASFGFSPYARTPVHDLPHNGVGVLAIHRDEWHALLRAYQADLPSGVDLDVLYGVAVEHW